MGILIGIIYAVVLCWGFKNGKSLSGNGVKTYRRSSRTLSSRR